MVETIVAILNSPMVINVVITVVGLAWTAFKGSEVMVNLRNGKWGIAVELLENAVEDTYENYVRERKADTSTAPEGKLAVDERAIARKVAVDFAKKAAVKKGLDLNKVIGDDAELEAMVSRISKKLKQLRS